MTIIMTQSEGFTMQLKSNGASSAEQGCGALLSDPRSKPQRRTAGLLLLSRAGFDDTVHELVDNRIGPIGRHLPSPVACAD